MDKPEKRKMKRVYLELPATLSVSEECETKGTIKCSTDNICGCGAFFHTDQPVSPGTEIDIDIVLPLEKLKKIDGKKALLKVAGSVTRTEERGLAIDFTGLKVLSIEQ